MPRARGIRGLRAAMKQKQEAEKRGDALEEERLQNLTKQMHEFKGNLESFAKQHKKEISKNPQFRQYFHQMCMKIGVDPLASSKGFWAELLGVGDFYYELGIQIIEQCFRSRKYDGGLMEVDKLLQRIQQHKNQKVTLGDIETAISKIRVLNPAFGIVKLGNKRVVKSVPVELNQDHNDILKIAEETASITVKEAVDRLGWTVLRVKAVLKTMKDESMAWVDSQDESGELRYWFPCLWNAELF